ncbi:MAG: acyltransferase family protein [Methyloprofundus sp.]|nr:acyltransferase family protein [Methyloprofundus sp.]
MNKVASMSYRSDIQCLRGIAVLLVVIFHIWPDFLPSGYVGVDIFFVISGFLMSALYLKGDPKKSACLQFYTRRLLRIIPSYLVTIGLFLLYSSFVFTPYEFLVTQKQALASLFLVPNIYLWSGEAYFNEFAFRPLLHLWTIGVEVQFYILVPIFFYLAKKQRVIFFLVMIVSFVACIIMVKISGKTAFFMLPFRIWEFLIGFSIAQYLSIHGNVKYNNPILKWCAALLICALFLAGFFVSHVENHPGIFALCACLTTGFILAFGLPAQLGSIWISKGLYRGLEKLGKYSYSLYLVHFPIIIAVYYKPFSGESIDAVFDIKLLYLATAILFGTLILHHCVELVNWKKFPAIKNTPKVGIAFVLLASCFLASYQANTMYFDEYEHSITKAPLDRSYWRCGKWVKLKSILNSQINTCLLTPEVSDDSKKALLVGDSHADAIKLSLAKALADNNTQLHFMIKSCSVGRGGCAAADIISIANSLSINTIYLHDKSSNFNGEAVKKLFNESQKEGIDIIYIDPIPTYKYSVPAYLYSVYESGDKDPDFNQDLAYFNKKYQNIHQLLNEIGIKRLPTLEYLCTPYCVLAKGSVSYYSDSHHLSLSGARELEAMLLTRPRLYKQP